MTDLIACLSGDKSLAHVTRLINDMEWSNIFLIADQSGKNNFKSSKKVVFVLVDFQKPVFDLIKDIQQGLNGKILDLDVALNLVSGTGKDHMAILSALLKLGIGIRLVAVTREGVKEI